MLAKHLRYIERDGAGRNGEPGRAYGPQTDEADLDAFKERCQDDRHHFRFIVSPEDSAELDDLRTYRRAPDEPDGGRPGDAAEIGGGRSLEHRQPARR
ncbi:hypothetical protein [Enterobacter cloacae complex sp. 288G10]|uniref:hypothetical protein n=1 Tax=Enterobacter cloacae complex sp. 288G10 TaxID=3395859 RepID=UPI003CF1D1BA